MKNLLLYTQILSLLILFSCKQKEQIGPSLNDISGPVIINSNLTASNSTPNFSTGGSIYFSAGFQKDANWVLTLTGNISGAVKTFSGVGKSISASDATWDGSSGTTISFHVEPVKVVLTFPLASNSSFVTQQITINIVATKNLNAEGVIVSSFSTSHSGWQSDWPYSVPYNGAGNKPLYAPFTFPAFQLPDGNNVLFMAGKPWQHQNQDITLPITPYVDFFTIKASAADVNYGTYFPLYSDPNQVYINFELYNTYNPANPVDTANNPYTWLQINVLEEGGISRTYEIKNPTWAGWKLFSINYNDLISTNTNPGQPNKVLQVQLVLLSTYNLNDQAGLKKNFASIGIDHLIFTNGKPYKP